MSPALTDSRRRQLLATPLSVLKGVGPSLTDKLSRLGIRTIEDALYTLPTRYEDRRELRPIQRLRHGCIEVFCGRIVSVGEGTTSRNQRKLFEVLVADESGQIVLKWFNFRRDWMNRRFQTGRRAVFIGEAKRFGTLVEVHHPEVHFLAPGQSVETLDDDDLPFGSILPVYPLTEGVTQAAMRKLMRQAVSQYASLLQSAIPDEILRRQQLMPLADAVRQAHHPPDESDLEAIESGDDPARRTLVFDEFFYLQLGLALRRQGVILEEGIPFEVSHRYTKPLAAMLPYRLTSAQKRVLGEIKHDLMQPHPMHRLVQGDVGSGKTMVAMMSALLAIENETQVALVAPTEILAEQHHSVFRQWFEALGLKVLLLSGSMGARERREVLAAVQNGEAQMLIGTHAVLQEGVEFKRLGLGIIDEQHRFGVRQRGVLRRKGENPHMLVMTATPIPRTLSLTLYGDLALSVIDELPPGRTPIQTRLCSERQRRQAYDLIAREVGEGRQAYIVYPLVEETEKSDLKAATEGVDELRSTIFPQARIGLLHGRMKSDEKDAVMEAFYRRELDILVATTVIEVGIDVPNASVMLIEHAERFGLAQLHQLRGRVGRGSAHSYCVLLRSEKLSQDGLQRLRVMVESNDGFRLAEADLAIRGPGEFLGTRQSGLPDFRVADILRDASLLERARHEAFDLADDPAFLRDPVYEETRQTLMERWGSRLELASIG